MAGEKQVVLTSVSTGGYAALTSPVFGTGNSIDGATDVYIRTTAGGVVTLTVTDLSNPRVFVVVKTNTGTNKITLACDAAWSINNGAAGASLDLAGSANAAIGMWTIVCDVATKTIWVSPAA